MSTGSSLSCSCYQHRATLKVTWIPSWYSVFSKRHQHLQFISECINWIVFVWVFSWWLSLRVSCLYLWLWMSPFSLFKLVNEEGGFDAVCKERRWTKISVKMGFAPGKAVGSHLRAHYERILYPYNLFQTGDNLHVGSFCHLCVCSTCSTGHTLFSFESMFACTFCSCLMCSCHAATQLFITNKKKLF